MSREIHLRLTGRAEQAFSKLIDAGFTEQDVLSRALWIFDQVVTTDRVAMLDAEGNVLFRFGLETKQESHHEPEISGDVMAVGRAEPESYGRATRAINLEDDLPR